jgi:hypothetical protein
MMGSRGPNMNIQLNPFTIIFPDWYDDRAQWEHQSKGFLPDVLVQAPDGTRYRLFFMDPVRLAQDLEAESVTGKQYLAEPGLVVVPDVTKEAISRAAAGLWADGFFKHLKPLE